MEFRKQVSLADYTSWQVGGPADWFCLPQSEADLEEALRFARDQKIPFQILGGGSNVLVSDTGVEGLLICLRKFSGLHFTTDEKYLNIECLSGTGKSELLKVFLKHQLEPALFLAGLPGDVGGGIVMNAGVAEALHPREFGEIVQSFEVLREDGTRQWFRADEVQWTYRHSTGWQPGIITKARLRWTLQPDAAILQKVRDANRVRLSKQPLDLPSCGSVFVNPPGHKSAQLIDGCGLKGERVGGAQVSLKHANFIVNTGGATASDIQNLISRVQETVKTKTGVTLQTEVVWIGRRS